MFLNASVSTLPLPQQQNRSDGSNDKLMKTKGPNTSPSGCCTATNSELLPLLEAPLPAELSQLTIRGGGDTPNAGSGHQH